MEFLSSDLVSILSCALCCVSYTQLMSATSNSLIMLLMSVINNTRPHSKSEYFQQTVRLMYFHISFEAPDYFMSLELLSSYQSIK